MSAARRIDFRDHADKAAWIDGAAWIDSRMPEVQAAAVELAGGHGVSNRTAARKICDWVREHVTYTRDQWQDGTLGERIADTAAILNERIEDCDGKARAVVALVRSLGRPGMLARIRAVINGDGVFEHAQAEVSADGGVTWDLAETIVEGVPYGLSPSVGARDATGQLRTR